mgnify:CR=1 FL=1
MLISLVCSFCNNFAISLVFVRIDGDDNDMSGLTLEFNQ